MDAKRKGLSIYQEDEARAEDIMKVMRIRQFAELIRRLINEKWDQLEPQIRMLKEHQEPVDISPQEAAQMAQRATKALQQFQKQQGQAKGKGGKR